MNTFTEELKNELAKKSVKSDGEKVALLSAFIRTGGRIFVRDGVYGLSLVTENESTASFIGELADSAFGITLDVCGVEHDSMSGRDKLTLEYAGADCVEILRRIGVIQLSGGEVALKFGINSDVIESDKDKIAYLIGAFLGGGSCTLPDEQTYSRTGYHFEIIFPDKVTAGDFCDLLCDFEILAKLVSRKDNFVVYVKSKEVISDLLNLMHTEKCLKKLNRIAEYKDKSNNDNRVNNCSVSNIDKAVTASVNQIKAIEIISQTVGLQSLDANLFEVAEARLADKNASMQELADRLGITKSCINHRMRKIIAMSSQLS